MLGAWHEEDTSILNLIFLLKDKLPGRGRCVSGLTRVCRIGQRTVLFQMTAETANLSSNLNGPARLDLEFICIGKSKVTEYISGAAFVFDLLNCALHHLESFTISNPLLQNAKGGNVSLLWLFRFEG